MANCLDHYTGPQANDYASSREAILAMARLHIESSKARLGSQKATKGAMLYRLPDPRNGEKKQVACTKLSRMFAEWKRKESCAICEYAALAHFLLIVLSTFFSQSCGKVFTNHKRAGKSITKLYCFRGGEGGYEWALLTWWW